MELDSIHAEASALRQPRRALESARWSWRKCYGFLSRRVLLSFQILEDAAQVMAVGDSMRFTGSSYFFDYFVIPHSATPPEALQVCKSPACRSRHCCTQFRSDFSWLHWQYACSSKSSGSAFRGLPRPLCEAAEHGRFNVDIDARGHSSRSLTYSGQRTSRAPVSDLNRRTGWRPLPQSSNRGCQGSPISRQTGLAELRRSGPSVVPRRSRHVPWPRRTDQNSRHRQS
jgi:hypothetical protein